ncbi:MAG: RimK family alpha-L-glutamate ligase [Proteobacteria bacterium]|nr:RimK family alpha-L-glutamate ligase [Pseudomonadota bacterium]
MPFDNEDLPTLSEAVRPPLIHGAAALSGCAYAGADLNGLLGRLGTSRPRQANPYTPPRRDPAWLFDASVVYQLGFRRAEALELQRQALAQSTLYRVASQSHRRNKLRVMAICAPGDLMVNTPLDFITNELNVRLDLLFIGSDAPLPKVIPDHDVAFFAVSEAGPDLLHRLQQLYAMWPRPVLNDPAYLPGLARDTLAHALADAPGICSPNAVLVERDDLDRYVRGRRPIPGFAAPPDMYPCLIRPSKSHAGHGLSHLSCDADLYAYLRLAQASHFYLTEFEDYRDTDNFYRKLRVAFIDRRPYLCHMAISHHWMVHYLNAGMTESAAKRAMEAEAMASFDTGFARRHAAAFAALHERLGFDYYAIDCAETRDGRLLVFEADTAAIIHLMDPPDLFPYKPSQMHHVFNAFGAMLERRATPADPVSAPAAHRIAEAVPA